MRVTAYCCAFLWMTSSAMLTSVSGQDVDKYIREVLIPSGYTEVPDNVIARSLEDIDRMRKEVSDAPVGKKEIADYLKQRPNRFDYNGEPLPFLSFKSKREKDQRLQTFDIARRLVSESVIKWKKPFVIPAGLLSEDGLYSFTANIPSTTSRRGTDFEERIGPDSIHAYVYLADGELVRVCIKGMPNDIAAKFETKQLVTFLGLVEGTETYQSVSGERTVRIVHYVDKSKVNRLIETTVPKEDRVRRQFSSPRRTWTSVDGKFTTEATLENATLNEISLKKDDGKSTVVPLVKLSENDRNWLDSFDLAKGMAKKLLEKYASSESAWDTSTGGYEPR